MEIVKDRYNSPVSFYMLQKRYIQQVSDIIMSNGILLIEAGTGFGKTLSNLYGALNVEFPSSRPKIIYLSKTHKQNEQVINELVRLNEVNKTKLITGLQMASRKQLCHIEHVANAFPITAIDMCKRYQELSSKNVSPEYTACRSCLPSKGTIPLPSVLTLNKLEQMANDYKGCGYLTARELLSKFDVITGHYNYFLNKDIKKAVGMDEEKAILILDEGHNLEDILTDQYSSSLSNYTMQNAMKEANGVDYQLLNSLTFFNNAIELFLNTHGKLSEEIEVTGPEMVEYFKSFGINESRVKALESRFVLVKENLFTKQKDRLGYYPSSLVIEEIIQFFSMEITKPKDVGYIIQKLQKGFRIRKECLNPALAFSDVRKQAQSIIICSGTLSPLPLWQEILGIGNDLSKTEKFGSLIDPRRVKVVSFSSDRKGNILTTKYSHRIEHPEIYSTYLESIIELVQANINSGGILLFTPSYDFQNSLELPPIIENTRCFQETQDAKESQKLLSNYINLIKKGDSALFAGVLGGKLSEGMDLPQELVRMVIIIGIPYPPPNDPVIKLKRNYYDQNIRKGLGTEWYNAQAFRKVSQALGRGWRTSDDYSIGILLDNRFSFKSSIEQLPLWIKNSIYQAKAWDDGKEAITTFLKKVKELEK